MLKNVPPMKGRIIGYKFIRASSRGMYNSNFSYDLPKKGKPGKWMRIKQDLPRHYECGFHVVYPQVQQEIAIWGSREQYLTLLIKAEFGGECHFGMKKRAYTHCRVLRILGEFRGMNKGETGNAHIDYFVERTRKLIRADKAKP